jgi:hypothetical protein
VVASWTSDPDAAGPCKAAGDDARHRTYLVDDQGWCRKCHYARRRHRSATSRTAVVKRLYGWAQAEVDALRGVQRGRCAICPRKVGVVKRGAMDHNHAMERAGIPVRFTVRGILCSTCNRYLGHIADNPDVAVRMFWYLIDPPAPHVLEKLARTAQNSPDGELNSPP